jgi:hypothetical protein
MKLFGKIFLNVFVLFAILEIVGFFFFHRSEPLLATVLRSLIQISFMSSIFALFLFVLYSYLRKHGRDALNDESFGKPVEEEIVLAGDFENSFQLCKESVIRLNKSRIKSENIDDGTIDAKTGISWQSWGERMRCNIKKISDNESRISLSSKPSFRFTALDYGKNRENINNILKILQPD